LKNVLDHKLTQFIAAIFILLSVYIIIYPPEIDFFRKSAEFAVHLMFGLLVLSLLLLVFNQKKLMFISMLACGFLAFYLKTASNSNLILPQINNLPKLKVAHFNLSSFDAYDPNFKKQILATESDVISFQEYTPDWQSYIGTQLDEIYPYRYTMVRIDLFGMAIYSKKEIIDVQVFDYKKIPNLDVTIHTGYQDVHLISSYIAPPSINSKKLNAKEHLQLIAQRINAIESPTITLGDFNQVYWSTDLNFFRDQTKLNNSRRNINITTKVPYDHIFYSQLLECIGFSELKNEEQNHLGIVGTFQAKSAITNPAILRTIGQVNEIN